MHEVPDPLAGELGASIGSQTKGNMNLPKVSADDPYVSGRRGVAFARDDKKSA